MEIHYQLKGMHTGPVDLKHTRARLEATTMQVLMWFD